MNIRLSKHEYTNLNEAKKKKNDVTLKLPKVSSSDIAKYELDEIDNVFSNSNNLFRLSSGIAMANINIEIDNPIALNYHYKHSGNFDEFINSINITIGAMSKKGLSSSDIEKLRKEYENQVQRTMKTDRRISQQVAQILSN